MSKRLAWMYWALEAILFAFAGILFFRGIRFAFADMPHFRHQSRLFWVELAYCLPLLWLGVTHVLLHPTSEKRHHHAKIIGAAFLLCLGTLDFVFAIVLWAKGEYQYGDQVFSGAFPLDLMLLDIISVAYGVWLITVRKKNPLTPLEPLVRPAVWRILFQDILFPFFVGISLYFFGGFWVLLKHNNLSSLQDPEIYFLFLALPLLLGYQEYLRLWGKENLSVSTKRIVAWSVFAWAFVLTVWLGIRQVLVPSLFVNAWQAYLPLDFMGSLNLAPYLLTLPFLILALKEALSLHHKGQK